MFKSSAAHKSTKQRKKQSKTNSRSFSKQKSAHTVNKAPLSIKSQTNTSKQSNAFTTQVATFTSSSENEQSLQNLQKLKPKKNNPSMTPSTPLSTTPINQLTKTIPHKSNKSQFMLPTTSIRSITTINQNDGAKNAKKNTEEKNDQKNLNSLFDSLTPTQTRLLSSISFPRHSITPTTSITRSISTSNTAPLVLEQRKGLNKKSIKNAKNAKNARKNATIKTHQRRSFRSTTSKRRGAAPKASPSLDRESLSRGEHVEILTFTQTLKKLTPYLWPKNDTSTKIRVVSALSCLILSKLLNVTVPVLFKESIDQLSDKVPSLQTPKSRAQKANTINNDTINTTTSTEQITTLNTNDNDPNDQITAQKITKKNIPNDQSDGVDATTSDIATVPIKDASPDEQTRLVDTFLDFLQSPEFLNISTTQLPFAVLVAWGLVRIIAALTNELKNALFTRISNIATTSIAVDLLRHLMHMDPAFHLDRNTGSISRAIDRGNKSIGMALSMITFRVIPTAFEMALVVGVLASTCGPQFSTVAIATLLTYIAFTVGVTQWRTKFKQQMNKASNTASAVAFDALMNVEAVQRFNNEELETGKYKQAWENYGDHQVKNEASLALLNWGQSAIFSVGLTAVMILAAQGVQDGSLTVGDLVLANALLLQLSLPLNIVGTVYRELKQAVLDMQTIFALRQTKSQIVNVENPVDFTNRMAKLSTKTHDRRGNQKEIEVVVVPEDVVLQNDDDVDGKDAVLDHHQNKTDSTTTPKTTTTTKDSITTDTTTDTITTTTNNNNRPQLSRTGGFSIDFEKVKFQYANAKTGKADEPSLLEDITVHVPAGTSIAFVGGSGSGKSTVLKLASRNFDVDDGIIRIDGVPIKDIELSSLHNAIGVVPQEAILFNDTIMKNIRYARPTATDDEVINAAKLAQIHDAIMSMRDGYSTIVGERGLKISGGQKQRISIARLMLLNPPIVMCDEATSALDSQTEYEIMQNLRNLTKQSKKTCIYIAHRLSTITHCDQIAVIDNGRIVELGTHHQLLQLGAGKNNQNVDSDDESAKTTVGGGGRYAAMWALQSTVDHLHLEDRDNKNKDNNDNQHKQDKAAENVKM